MSKITIIGDSDRQIKKIIDRIIDKCYFDIKTKSKQSYKNIILVYDESDFCISSLKENSIFIVLSNNKETISRLIQNDISIITVGMASNDIVTFSSITSDTLVVSLQREITDYENNIIEPKEIHIDLSTNVDENKVLLITALLLFLNIKNNNIVI